MAARVILIILDSVGIGEMPDSCCFGDEGSNTLRNTALAVGGLNLPHMESLGLGNIEDIPGVKPRSDAKGAFGKMAEKSNGKDTTTGHWEMMGIITKDPRPTYPQGFPTEIIKEFEKSIGRKILGNKVASGTAIIEELGPEHMATASPIVYTSADSVFQIAAHEEVIPLEELYEMCKKARQILQGEHGVGRVIARPFVGTPGNFIRTANRHDYSLEPPQNILNFIVADGQQVISVGKIKDIFAGCGISEAHPIKNNEDGLNKIFQLLDAPFKGLLFANLVDFDQLFGHRNNAEGYAEALQKFDKFLPHILEKMQPEDILLISADHGCDPTTASTDHSREYVPLLVYGDCIKAGTDLKIRSSFADLGQTIAEFLGVKVKGLPGESFKQLIKK